MSARTTPRTAIGATIRKNRTDARLTQDQLGERTALGQKRISDLEAGKLSPSLAEIAALELGFDLPPGALYIQAGCVDLPALLDAGLIDLPSSTLTAITTDEMLSPEMKSALRTVYEAMPKMKPPNPAQRRRAG